MLAHTLLAISAAVSVAAAAVEVRSGGLTILAQNDLSNTPSAKGSAAILIETKLPYTASQAACEAISETLFDPQPNNPTATTDLQNALNYLVFSGKYPKDTLFWIKQTSSSYASKCRALDTTGRIIISSDTNCRQSLPILCTQTAPPSSASYADTSKKFRVQRTVGRQTLAGFRDQYSWRFLGVRYAQRPQRFGYSKLYDDGPVVGGAATAVDAVEFGAKCLQLNGTKTVGSEDCLFLNVYTASLPAEQSVKAQEQEQDKKRQQLKPVMVYIHGGGYETLSGSEPERDGTNLASRGDVVVVSFNYRLSTFGFLALGDGTANGNYGLRDIVTALQWIKKYIHIFGGDAARVTVFGESAGAGLIRALLASEKAGGLFRAAIMQSVPVLLGSQYPTVNQEVEKVTAAILKQSGCANATIPLACLRSYDAKALLNLPTRARFVVLSTSSSTAPTSKPRPSPLTKNTTAYAAPVPLLIGIDRNEGGIMAPYPPPAELALAISQLSAAFGTDISPLLASGLFPPGTGPDAIQNTFAVTSRLVTDAIFQCPAQAIAYAASKNDIFPSVRFFTFNRTYSSPGYTNKACTPPTTPSHPLGDAEDPAYLRCHSGETFYVFGSLARQSNLAPERDGRDRTFSQVVVDYWTAFARQMDPDPDRAFLKARGYTDTLKYLERSDKWRTVDPVRPQGLWLQWGGGARMERFGEVEQCKAIGVPLEAYA